MYTQIIHSHMGEAWRKGGRDEIGQASICFGDHTFPWVGPHLLGLWLQLQGEDLLSPCPARLCPGYTVYILFCSGYHLCCFSVHEEVGKTCVSTWRLLFLSKNDPSNKITPVPTKLRFPFRFGDIGSVNLWDKLALKALERGEDEGGWVGKPDWLPGWWGGVRSEWCQLILLQAPLLHPHPQAGCKIGNSRWLGIDCVCLITLISTLNFMMQHF